MTITRRELIAASAGLFGVKSVRASERSPRSFWLFSLLRPPCLNISPAGTARLHCISASRTWILEGRESICAATSTPEIRITDAAGGPVACILEVPNQIRRSYFGVLAIRSDRNMVLPVLTMDCETATSSIVGAELPVSTAPLDALAAQAVVSRSVICGSGAPRHAFADFCDTTHCQFLRSPASPSSIAASAVQQTAGVVLVQDESILVARYGAACGGKTEGGTYFGQRYLAVPCEICSKRRTIRRGHGWGLCQEGAIGLAREGWSWQAILAKYYPNATPNDNSVLLS